jgi:hypothetical protein
MPKRCLVLILLAVAAAAAPPAVRPVGRIRSTEPFRLRGATMPVAGMRWWPIVAGDDIVAGASPAIITFDDGTRVTLARDSRLKLESAGGRTRVRLVEGSLQYRLGRLPKVDIYNRDSLQTASSGAVSTVARESSASRAPASSRAVQAAPPPVSPSR